MSAAAPLLGHKPTLCPAEKESGYLPPSKQVWDRKKAAADLVAGMYAQAADTHISKHAAKVAACSETLELLKVVSHDTGEIAGYRVQSWKCRERHCPVCQSARARKLHLEFSAVLPAIMEQVPGGVFLFLTLTVRNCPVEELRATLADMGMAWKRLLRQPEFQIVRGWIRGTEVTRAEDGQAHPHFHVLLLVPPSYFSKYYIKHEKWIELWQKAARLNYLPTVDIRRVKTVKGGIEEAIKAATYSVKPAELSENPAWFHEFHKQVSGLRFLATGGVIKAMLGGKTGGEADDIAEGQEPEGEQGRIQVFDWNRPAKRYRQRKGISSNGD